ncbi:hypothetical protein RCL_jg21630.t1 [Rhizophagus clarus]|uniref:Uncharacterized protein n=1 Tax=Rhizophagus clarus TaxID=94130 RepID=A0A8H3QFB7_9GLOM|nr:hypothetical protein RCL_jg21630.t1 [Rhizophagus clarus]
MNAISPFGRTKIIVAHLAYRNNSPAADDDFIAMTPNELLNYFDQENELCDSFNISTSFFEGYDTTSFVYSHSKPVYDWVSSKEMNAMQASCNKYSKKSWE